MQHKLGRIRAPRVHITYDVEVAGAIEKKELPFVFGILADLSGIVKDESIPLRERKFIDIDRDNINDVMEGIKPSLKISILKDKTSDTPKEQSIELNFEHLEDFNPLKIARQVPELNTLYEARFRLKDLQTKMDGNEVLEKLLIQVMIDKNARKELRALIDAKISPAEPEPEPEPVKKKKGESE